MWLKPRGKLIPRRPWVHGARVGLQWPKKPGNFSSFSDSLLIRALTAQNGYWRPPKKLDVGFEALVPHVPEVHPRPFFKADVAAAAHLPEACQPRLHGQATKLPGSTTDHFANVQRARTDQRHLPEEHVEQLRRLVEARLSQ